MKILVGNTGLIGKTLVNSIDFDLCFNSSNIHEFESKVQNNSEIYLSCLPATKWLINQNLRKDIENINKIIQIIATKNYSKVTLFSTIDVYNSSPLRVNEEYSPNIKKLSYGENRYFFELLITEFIKTDRLCIFRLPALFNKFIKKNILFDLLNNNNVEQININSAYQWYNLNNLHKDIDFFSNGYNYRTVFNLFPEPVETAEIIKLFPEYSKFTNSKRVEYDYTTVFNTYLHSKQESLNQIKDFISESRSK